MKKFVVTFSIALTLLSCQEPREDGQQSKQTFNEDVGALIPSVTATRWTARARDYKKERTSEQQVIAATDLRRILSTPSEKIGIFFQHATDHDGQHRILLTPFVAGGKLLDMPSYELSTSVLCSAETSKQWVQSYKNTNPEGPWAHFFGINVFNKILEKSDFLDLEVVEGINDVGESQLVLFAHYGTASANGRTANTTTEAYDTSWPCPATCPEY